MKFSLAIVVVLAGISVSGMAQQSVKVKPSAPEKTPKSTVPIGKAGTASAATSKDLQRVEHESAKPASPSRPAAKKPGTASALKPVKDKPNPPINFGGTGGGKNAGAVKQSSNPYKGRLKQKHGQ